MIHTFQAMLLFSVSGVQDRKPAGKIKIYHQNHLIVCRTKMEMEDLKFNQLLPGKDK